MVHRIPRNISPRSRFLPLSLAVAAAVALAGCSGSDSGTQAQPAEVRLGYLPNLTQAPALVGLQDGFFQDALGAETTVTGVAFSAGPAALEALFAGSIDAAFIGPSPTITGYTQSGGEALKVIAGAAANGASLVVRNGLDTVGDLNGTTLATPQLGNTQDVALRYFLEQNGYETDTEGGGDISIQPQDNATSLRAFAAGEIDGAWLPEPWATRMVLEAGGHVLVDETDVWPGGQFVTANLVVRTAYLTNYPDAVSKLLSGLLASLDEINSDPSIAKATVNTALENLTGSRIDDSVLDIAWDHILFTSDPLADTLIVDAEHAKKLGFLDSVDLGGLYYLTPLNSLLADAGRNTVTGP